LLLLLPFLASHFLFFFSLHYPYDGKFTCVKKIPSTYSYSHTHDLQPLQLAKVKQVTKNHSQCYQSKELFLLFSLFCITVPALIAAGRNYMVSCVAMELSPTKLFPSRASPA
jgi:hypothetical protein